MCGSAITSSTQLTRATRLRTCSIPCSPWDGPQRLLSESEWGAQLAKNRPETEFAFSYRTGWDPQGMDPAQIRDERDRYAEAGVEHVVSAPWRTDADAWIRSMEMLVDIVEPDLVTL